LPSARWVVLVAFRLFAPRRDQAWYFQYDYCVKKSKRTAQSGVTVDK